MASNNPISTKLFCEENGTSSDIPCSQPPRGPGTKRDPSQEFGESQEPNASNRCAANEFTLDGKIAPGYYASRGFLYS